MATKDQIARLVREYAETAKWLGGHTHEDAAKLRVTWGPYYRVNMERVQRAIENTCATHPELDPLLDGARLRTNTVFIEAVNAALERRR